jgi:acetyl-CoA carboxylase biotin carboxyl carrier protein
MADKKKKGGLELPKVFSRSSNDPRSALDIETLRQVVEILDSTGVTELEWKKGDEALTLRRGPATVTQLVHTGGMHAPVMAHHAPAPSELVPRPSTPSRPTGSAAAPEKKGGHVISSPFVGTFYRNPAPDQPPFAEVGQVVKKGQVLCIVEAMKLMNEIESEVAGRVAEILANNAQPVEFGQALFRIEPV